MGFWSGVKSKVKRVYTAERQHRLHDKYMGGSSAVLTRVEKLARAGYRFGKRQYQAERERRRDVRGEGNYVYSADGRRRRKARYRSRNSRRGSRPYYNRSRY